MTVEEALLIADEMGASMNRRGINEAAKVLAAEVRRLNTAAAEDHERIRKLFREAIGDNCGWPTALDQLADDVTRRWKCANCGESERADG